MSSRQTADERITELESRSNTLQDMINTLLQLKQLEAELQAVKSELSALKSQRAAQKTEAGCPNESWDTVWPKVLDKANKFDKVVVGRASEVFPALEMNPPGLKLLGVYPITITEIAPDSFDVAFIGMALATAGKSREDALLNAEERLEKHLEYCYGNGIPIPLPRSPLKGDDTIRLYIAAQYHKVPVK